MFTQRSQRSKSPDEDEQKPSYEELMATLSTNRERTAIAQLQPDETLTGRKKTRLIKELKKQAAKEEVLEDIERFEGKLGSKFSTTEGNTFMDRARGDLAELESMGVRSGWLRNWAQQTYTNLLADDFPLPHKRVDSVLKEYAVSPNSRPGSATAVKPAPPIASSAWESPRPPPTGTSTRRRASVDSQAMSPREPPAPRRPSVHEAHRQPTEGLATDRRPGSGLSVLTGATTLDRAYCNDYNAVQLRLARHPREFSMALTKDRNFAETRAARHAERQLREEQNRAEAEAALAERTRRQRDLASKAEETREKFRGRLADRKERQLELREPAAIQRAQQREREEEDRRTMEAALSGDVVIFPSHFAALSPAGRRRAVAAGTLPSHPLPAAGPMLPTGPMVSAAMASGSQPLSQSSRTPPSSTAEAFSRVPPEMVDLDLFERRLTRLVARRQGAPEPASPGAPAPPPVTVGTTPRSRSTTGRSHRP